MQRTTWGVVAVILLVNVGIGVLVASLAGSGPVPPPGGTWSPPVPRSTSVATPDTPIGSNATLASPPSIWSVWQREASGIGLRLEEE